MRSFTIYGFDECPYCQKAKNLLTTEGAAFEYVNVGNNRETRSCWLDCKGFEGKDRTFPRVYFNNSLLGGYTDLENFLLGL